MQCDGHFGIVKTLLKGSAGNGPIISRDQVLQAFRDIKAKNKENSQPNQVIDLTVTHSDVSLKPLENQIRKFFEWEITADGTCRSRELTGVGEWTSHTFKHLIPKQK